MFKIINIIKILIFVLFLKSWPVFAERSIQTRIAWCAQKMDSKVQENYIQLVDLLRNRTTLLMNESIVFNGCQLGQSDLWWFDKETFLQFDQNLLKKHIANGGGFLVEGGNFKELDAHGLENDSLGLKWEDTEKNGMFYRSFYLLRTLDGCEKDGSKVLMVRKKQNAQAPIGLVLPVHFLTEGKDCFGDDYDFKTRSLINIIFAFLTTDYKEDQRKMPEILKRIENLGLEP